MTDGGRLALVFDDGYASDRDELWPVLREHDAPACFAVVPEWLDEEGHLTVDELGTLVDAGSEVVAHGRRHRYLQAQPLAAAVEPGDERVRLGGGREAEHSLTAGDEYELVDDGRSTTVTVSAFEDGQAGPVATLPDGAGGVDEPFRAGETALRPTADVIEDEVGGVLGDFGGLGHEPASFVFPYDAADARAWRTAREHYDVVANAAVRSLPNPPATDPTNLRRYYLETDALTRPEIGTYLDAVAEGRTGVLAGHSDWETVPPERVSWTIRAARERGIEVVTLSDLA